MSNAAQASGRKAHQFTVYGKLVDAQTGGQILRAAVTVTGPDGYCRTDTAYRKSWRSTDKYDELSLFYILIDDLKKDSVYMLSINHPDYDEYIQTLDFKNVGEREYDRNLGVYKMKKKAKILDEVTVASSKIKFYNKGDTIIYDAEAFQLAEGSMLDALIRQLPGVELKQGGQIFVNGRYVENLLLNGKDFFKGDNKVMLDNLEAYVVKDIQVYEKETDLSRFAGRRLEDPEYVMNVKIKKEYNGAFTVNTQGGYGSDDRYIGRIFAMYFTPQQRYTIYANVNNLSDDRKPGENDSWMPSAGKGGTYKNITAGGDYLIGLDDGRSSLQGDIQVNRQLINLSTITNTENYYSSGNLTSRAINNSLHRNFKLTSKHTLNFEKNKFRFTAVPSMRYDHNRGRSLGKTANFNQAFPFAEAAIKMDSIFARGINVADRSEIVNAYYNEAFSGRDRFYFGTNMYGTVRMPNSSDVLNLFLLLEHNNDRNRSQSDYMIGYGDDALRPQARRQRSAERPNHKNSVMAQIAYHYMLNRDLSIELCGDFRHDAISRHSNFYLAEITSDAVGDYTIENLDKLTMILDPTNSYISTDKSYRWKVSTGISYYKGNTRIGIDVPLAYMHRSLDYDTNGMPITKKHNEWMLMNVTAQFSWHNKNTYISAKYSGNTSQAPLIKMIDIPNTTNPLNIYLGNPDLRSAFTHSLNATLRLFMNGRYNAYFSATQNVVRNDIVQGYVYDTSTGRRYYKSYNVHGNHGTAISTTGTYYFGRTRQFNVRAGFAFGYNERNQMFGEDKESASIYKVKNFSYTPSLSFEYSIGKQKVSLYGSAVFHNSRSSRMEYNSLNVRDYNIGLNGVFKLPADFGITTGFVLNRRSGYDSPDIDKSTWIWNLSLIKSFNKGKWICSLNGFDLLHQLTNISYNVGPTGRVETFTNTLPRYIMGTVQYKFSTAKKGSK